MSSRPTASRARTELGSEANLSLARLRQPAAVARARWRAWRFAHQGHERQVPAPRWYDARREAAKLLGCSEQDCTTVEAAKRANGTAAGRETGGGR